MTDQERLDLIDYFRECIGLLTAGVDRDDLPEPPETEEDQEVNGDN